jgi:FkbM family methyltransferase
MGLRSALVTPIHKRICRRRGVFTYFGCKVFFPPRSVLFERTFGRGVFEAHNVRLLTGFAHAGGVILDVGANIGLMSVPLLASQPDVHVVSYEPSPNSLPFLEQTHARSPHAARWEIVGKALADAEGEIGFHVAAPALGAFDGPANTSRGGPMRRITVPATTLDAEWERLGRPRFLAIKLDVEGGELRVLRGGERCLAAHQPPILLEVHRGNLDASGFTGEDVMRFASAHGYGTYAVPAMARVDTLRELELHLLTTEDFLFWPVTRSRPDAARQMAGTENALEGTARPAP